MMTVYGYYMMTRGYLLLWVIVFFGMCFSQNISSPATIIVNVSLFSISMLLLRVVNDGEDWEKDQIALGGKGQPLSKEYLKKLQGVLLSLLGGVMIAALWVWPVSVSLLFFLFLGYVWLLQNRFYSPDWWRRHPFLYTASFQAIFFWMALLIVLQSEGSFFSGRVIVYPLLIFLSFFVFEICRKLNPYAHPIALSYVQYYGFRSMYLFVCALLLCSALCAYYLGKYPILWPCQLAVAVVLFGLFQKPKKYRRAELASLISLIIHVWS